MNDITAIILTKNEEVNIERCIRSVRGLAGRIVVVDSGSTDQTVPLARSLGVEVFEHPFLHYADQFNWALDNIGVQTTWVYRIDADEEVPAVLREELLRACDIHAEDDVNGFLMKHRLNFLGRDLMHGGAYPFVKLTVFKFGVGRFENRPMGEHVVLSEGRTLMLTHDCIHHDFKSLTAFVEKHNSYATREVADATARAAQQSVLYKRAERTKRIRDGFYYKMPMFLRAKLYYYYRFYFRMGFLDGRPGKIYAMLQAYFYRWLVDAKLYEQRIGTEGDEV